jgi:hypothetical protein
MQRPPVFATLAFLALPFAAACGDPAGPEATTLIDISPAPAATGVATTTALTFTFSRPMMSGMEQYLDLHQGGIGGPVIPMSCGWDAGQTTLTCTPAAPLAPGTQYTVHLGTGMTDESGGMVTMQHWTGMGGQWATGGMMGGSHAGQATGMMGAPWRHGSDHYGMLFEFTTT